MVMVPDFLKYLSQDEEKHFSARKYYSSIFFTKDQSPHKIDSLNDPDDDPVPSPDQGDDETGYYSPELYRDEEEYYGSPLNQSEDDALVLFTTSFIEEEVIRKCINEISPDYLRSKEWELRWLAAKVRFRA